MIYHSHIRKQFNLLVAALVPIKFIPIFEYINLHATNTLV